MSNFKNWIRVETNTRLEMAVDVPSGKIVTARVRVVHPAGSETIVQATDLQPGPTTIRLAATSGSYVARVLLAFADACTVTFRARLLKPGGGVHGRPFSCQLRGSAGAVKRATVVCTMQPAS